MFLTFEGIEGSSKTTQAKLLSSWLNNNGINHLLTKEPGTVLSKECQQIRKLLLSPENDLSPRAELMLYLADRAQHVDNCIRPALDAGKWVVSDRYSWSTYVYQGYGRGLIDELSTFFRGMLDYAAGELWPDLTFIMDCPVEVGLSRAKSSNVEFEGGDRMERETLDFHQKLRHGFLEVAKNYSHKCVILDATKSIEELHDEVKKIVEGIL
jgi:dTMP kinase